MATPVGNDHFWYHSKTVLMASMNTPMPLLGKVAHLVQELKVLRNVGKAMLINSYCVQIHMFKLQMN